MNAGLTLVLDLGTHKCRAVAMDARGKVAARATSPPYPTHRAHPGWAEQEPEDWWKAAVACIRDVLAETGTRRVCAVIPVGHGPSHLPLDAEGKPIGRSLIWQDTRARAEADWIAEHTSVEQRFAALGLHLPMAPGMGPAKLLWLRDHEPERYEKTAALIQPKDYLTLRLTGEVVSDRYGLKDLVHAHTGEFDPWYADVLGLRRSLIPRMLTPWSLAGHTTASQARETGLPVGLPVGCGTIDAFAGLIGSGGQDDGDVCDVSGTSEIVGLVRAAPAQPFEAFLCYPLVGGRSVAFGVTRAAGDSIDWFVRQVAGASDFGAWMSAFEARQNDARQNDARQNDARQAGKRLPFGSGPVLFWPYLDGERSPLWDADARGMFCGLDLNTDLDALARAVLEGVAFSIRHNLDLLAERTGTTPRRMWVGGGTARLALFNQIKADVTGLEVLVPGEYEATARGAVAMMRVALGESPDVLTATQDLVGTPIRLSPRPAWRAHFDRLIPIYTNLATMMRPVYRELAAARSASLSDDSLRYGM